MLTEDEQFQIMFSQLRPSESTATYDSNECKNCGSVLRDEHRADGDIVCRNCGCVTDSFIDLGAEWGSYANDDGSYTDNSRSDCFGSNPLFNNSTLGTSINTFGKNIFMARLAKQTLLSSKDRAIFTASKNMDQKNASTEISKREMMRAKTMFKEFNKEVLTRGRIRQGVQAACVYVACRDAGVPRSIKQMSSAYNINPEDFNHGLKHIQAWCSKKDAVITPSPDNPYDVLLMTKLQSICNHDRSIVKKILPQTLDISKQVADSGIFEGKTPIGVVAGIITHVISEININITKNTISEHTGVSQPTINKIVKQLQNLNT